MVKRQTGTAVSVACLHSANGMVEMTIQCVHCFVRVDQGNVADIVHFAQKLNEYYKTYEVFVIVIIG